MEKKKKKKLAVSDVHIQSEHNESNDGIEQAEKRAKCKLHETNI